MIQRKIVLLLTEETLTTYNDLCSSKQPEKMPYDKADILFFKENIQTYFRQRCILNNRPVLNIQADKRHILANITGSCNLGRLNKRRISYHALRPTFIKSAIKEMLWIYQDQSNSLDL